MSAEKKGKKALLFGASGFVGNYLLEGLLNDPDYEQVTVVVRKDLNISNQKLKVLIGDYHSLPDLKNEIVADEVFIALGTTKKNTPDQKTYYQVDHDYPVLAAQTGKEKGAKSVFLVSAVGPDADSSVFYIRTKGETERDIIAQDLQHTHIFRPSMIMGNRKESRTLEKSLITIFSVINPLFIGPMQKFRGIEGKDIAKAMLAAAKRPAGKLKVYEWKEMHALL
ncbi:NAD(P)H-binding protein [Dyadobacter chenwenxiniae]|uniref:NAD(P)H-binding protein n=1 Tax=Dyadobacter chenwenxiniae TaxID=2906456 RepID=A0A9X1PPL5_9BACT|nr:NAD(P)H-binding protein [Dyadobacter chenwenxiniae]MCF0065182.1 NAD(P)H-binding protein [Dyadobacter chenwenxiniae]UON84549.1 NAD(P)H-binding protein [Dyadobacter chenwenxiniae]